MVMPKFRKPLPAELPDPETIDVQALSDELKAGSLDMICVLGPTASGKTRYAVWLARELAALGLPAEIISADSRQVYRGMDIGTGKDLAEYGEIPYHVIDVREAGTQYNVYDFTQDFQRAYEDIRSRGCVPILCGGTGLYINAVTAGYDFRSHKPLSVPAVEFDGGTSVSGSSRHGSFLSEVVRGGSGVTATARTEKIPRTFFIGTLVSRDVRNARIDARLRARLQEGMIDEIRGLLDRGIPAETLIGYGLEYKYVTLFLQGEFSEQELFDKLSIAIHQFAKRQMTWFRGMERSGVKIHWVEV